MTLTELNQLSAQQCHAWFFTTCGCQSWARSMTEGRPYRDMEDLEHAAKTTWQALSESNMLEAFTAHPMIGDLSTLKAKFANTKAMAGNEQSGTSVASNETLEALHKANHEYLAKNGFIFIICATGLSAEHMLSELLKRLHNDRETEVRNAANEQIKITLLRIHKGMLED